MVINKTCDTYTEYLRCEILAATFSDFHLLEAYFKTVLCASKVEKASNYLFSCYEENLRESKYNFGFVH